MANYARQPVNEATTLPRSFFPRDGSIPLGPRYAGKVRTQRRFSDMAEIGRGFLNSEATGGDFPLDSRRFSAQTLAESPPQGEGALVSGVWYVLSTATSWPPASCW